MHDETPAQQSVDRRFWALVKILLCLLGYLGLVCGVYWTIASKMVSFRVGIGFLLMTNCTLLFVALVVIFKPYRK